MKYCINCGNKLEDEAAFCAYCGAKQPFEKPKEEKKVFFGRTTPEVPESDNYVAVGLVSSQATRGMGLWTSICLGFANFFGTKCKHYAQKIERAKNDALNDIVQQGKRMNADGIIDIKFALSGLSVIVSGTAVKIVKK